MRILDRYILKSVVGIFLSCIFVFLFLYVIIDVLTHLDDILKQNAGIRLLVQYYLTYLPVMFVQVAPFACLLSTLYTFGKLNHDNEIIAMRSSGMSVAEITKTVIIAGTIVSLMVFWLGDRVIPSSLALNHKIRTQMEKGNTRPKDKKYENITNLSLYGLKNRLYFISKFSPSTDTMEGITILEHDEHQNITKKIVANRGVYKEGLWTFYQCITYDFDPNGQIISEPRYLDEEIMTVPESPRDFINQRQLPELMNIAGLDEYIWKMSNSGATSAIRSLKVDLYQRFTSPFTSLIIIILGVPFALMIRKRATGLSSIGISIVVGFLYYIVDAISIALGKSGFLPPLFSASLSHIIGLTCGLYLINKLP